MFNKKNPMRYFSGSTFARLPLYKLAAGGTAVVLAASIGLGAFAASVGPLSAPEPSPTPIVTATPETAATPTPSPTPSPTPEPDRIYWKMFEGEGDKNKKGVSSLARCMGQEGYTFLYYGFG